MSSQLHSPGTAAAGLRLLLNLNGRPSGHGVVVRTTAEDTLTALARLAAQHLLPEAERASVEPSSTAFYLAGGHRIHDFNLLSVDDVVYVGFGGEPFGTAPLSSPAKQPAQQRSSSPTQQRRSISPTQRRSGSSPTQQQPFAVSTRTPEPRTQTKKVCQVHLQRVDFNQLGEVDQVHQFFTARVYLEFILVDGANDPHLMHDLSNVVPPSEGVRPNAAWYLERLEVMNTRDIIVLEKKLRTTANGNDILFIYHMRGTFYEAFELHDFPFDGQVGLANRAATHH